MFLVYASAADVVGLATFAAMLRWWHAAEPGARVMALVPFTAMISVIAGIVWPITVVLAATVLLDRDR